jgi:hypothetical protein
MTDIADLVGDAAHYAHQADELADDVTALRAALQQAQSELTDIKQHWMKWCDSHALDRIEALQAELDRVMQAAANGAYCRQTHYPAGGTV